MVRRVQDKVMLSLEVNAFGAWRANGEMSPRPQQAGEFYHEFPGVFDMLNDIV